MVTKLDKIVLRKSKEINPVKTYKDAALNSLIKQKRSIHNALLKYGHENFTLEILEYCQENELMKREQYYLDLYNPKYNILKFAYSPLGRVVGKKTRAILALAIRQYRKNNPWSVKDLMNLKARAIQNVGVPVTVLNIFTNERWNFNSLTEGGNFLGVDHSTLHYALKGGNLINKIYLVSKKEGNLDPLWGEALTKLHARAMKSLVTVLNLKTNETIKFGSLRLAGEFLGISGASVYQAIKKGSKVKGLFLVNRDSSELRPTKLLENKLKSRGRVGIPIKILNLKTSEILEFSSQVGAGKFLGLDDSTLIQSIQDRNTVKGIYIISKKGARPWTGEEELAKLHAKAIKREIIVSNIETNETLEFSSPDAVGEFLKITGSGVRQAIKKGSKVKGIYRITKKEAPTLTNEDMVNIERMLKF